MAWFKCIGSNGGGVSDIVKFIQSEYDALAIKDDNTFYQIYDPSTNIAYKTYKGNNYFSKYKTSQEIENYDYYWEDLQYKYPTPNSDPSGLSINTDIQIFNSTNLNKDWQLEFNCDYDSTKNVSEIGVIGYSNNGEYEIFFDNAHPNKIGIWGTLSETGTTDWYDYTNGQEVILNKENGIITIYINGTEVNSYTLRRTSSDNGTIYIGSYTPSTYVFYGVIRYVGFKWLS